MLATGAKRHLVEKRSPARRLLPEAGPCMSDILLRLKQRKLVQWAIAYVAFAFALLQGTDIVAQRFDWPAPVEKLLILALAIGLVITLVLAWYHCERRAEGQRHRDRNPRAAVGDRRRAVVAVRELAVARRHFHCDTRRAAGSALRSGERANSSGARQIHRCFAFAQ